MMMTMVINNIGIITEYSRTYRYSCHQCWLQDSAVTFTALFNFCRLQRRRAVENSVIKIEVLLHPSFKVFFFFKHFLISRQCYLIRESLRGGVSDLAAVGYARDLCSHLQHVGQGQISYVRVPGAIKS